MPDDDRLLELVVCCEELREAGQSINIEEVCRECPELVPALRARLQALGAMNAALAGESTLIPVESVAGEPAARHAMLPELPGYEILRESGRGGMGVVYLARQKSLDRLVALKVLLGGRHASAASRARFKAEVESIARLQHPNLIQVFEVGEHEGHTFFSMEFVGGGNLQERIGSTPQPPHHAAELVALLARATQAAHERGVIHRDLKPENVLLSDFSAGEEALGVRGIGIPKISDFGLAKRMDIPSSQTRTEHIMGTPSYMAPEQALGQSKDAGPATDIYALGAILYRLLTGRPPFQSDASVETLRQVVEDEPVSPRQVQPSIPVDLETICLKCLRKQAGQRYASAAALADDLRRFLAHEPILAKPVGWWGRLLKWARRRPAAASLIAVSGLAVILLLALEWWFHLRLSRELQNTRSAHQRALATQGELKLAFARQVADGLDADFRLLATVPDSIAALLAQRDRYDEAELEGWVKTLVKQVKRIFGLGIAFEPRRFMGQRVHDRYCLYAHEIGDGVSMKQLLPPEYPLPLYLDREWYQTPKKTGHPWWSEPRIGQRANGTPMITYATPVHRHGEFIGVVIADLSIRYFREFHNQLLKQYVGSGSYSFVISAGGTFLFHPNPRYEFPAPDSSLSRIHAAPDFVRLMQQMREQDSGTGRATDFDTGQPATFYFAKVAATGCHFVLVQPGLTDEERLNQLAGR
jgi:Protein kinase domain/Cache domain